MHGSGERFRRRYRSWQDRASPGRNRSPEVSCRRAVSVVTDPSGQSIGSTPRPDIEQVGAAAQVRAEVRPRERHIPGEAGLWVFILGDMSIFALFFATILFTRGQSLEVFRASQQELHPPLALINTVLLLIGSLFVVRGVSMAREGAKAAPRYFLATVACALGFTIVKAVEYSLLARAGHTPVSNTFFTYYFGFTGIHLAHVLIGAVLMAILAAVTRRRPTAGRIRLIEACACYWHMVDALWLLLFPLLYLVR